MLQPQPWSEVFDQAYLGVVEEFEDEISTGFGGTVRQGRPFQASKVGPWNGVEDGSWYWYLEMGLPPNHKFKPLTYSIVDAPKGAPWSGIGAPSGGATVSEIGEHNGEVVQAHLPEIGGALSVFSETQREGPWFGAFNLHVGRDMPSGWNPFLYIKTAFGTIDQVKYVPGSAGVGCTVLWGESAVTGSKKPDKPDFVDRFLFWRRCALRVGSICSLIWLVCSLHEFQAAWRNVRDKLDQFPEMVRPYFSRFIYAELACQTASELASVIAVFIFMRAWKEHENFERSSDLTRLGWFFNTMGPFLPYLLVPLSFFFRVDYFQRDVCASVIGMMAHDPMSSLVFSEAASQASEPDLSAALSNPLAKPPRFGEPGFDTSPAADWTAMNDIGDGHNVEIPRVFGPVYPGVVPKALEMLAALFGAGHAFTGDFCKEEEGGNERWGRGSLDPSITKENLEAVGEADAASLLEGDWIQQHFSITDSNDPSIASLRQKLIKVYQNMTHQTTAQAARARQIIKEVQAAGMASFQTLSGGDFLWPRPEGVRASEKKAPGNRQKFFRQRDSISVGPDGQFSKPELLETAAPDLSAGLGKEAMMIAWKLSSWVMGGDV
eukprot:s237_g3.t1